MSEGNQFDMSCPKCSDDTAIDIAAIVHVRLCEDGTDVTEAENGDHEWDDTSFAACRACGFEGTVKDFLPEAETPAAPEGSGPRPGEPRRHLIRNAIETPDGTILISHHRHDFRQHVDKNGKTYMVDGGLDYCRRSANGDEKDLCLYDDESHEVQRQVICWGTYGLHGDQPLVYKPVEQMETGHIRAVLEECNPRAVIRACLEKELAVREQVEAS